MSRFALLLFLSSALVAQAASAQAPPTPKTPPGPVAPAASSENCAPSKSVPPQGRNAPDGTTTGQAGEPLGDKLARSGGVLCPPAGVDPEIRAPTPDAGNTPVIRPPGSPGGNPNVVPK